MAFVLFGSALAFLIPHGGISAFARWVQYGRDGRVASVMHELDTYERRRTADVPAKKARREAPVTVSGEIVTKASPRDRMKLDTVRDALKGLGYKRDEYGPLVAAMDPSVDFEVLVKGALKELRSEVN